ncbi:MAG: hypothetical protein KGM24_08320 [Elusimicrobia bacterium]|nr:hypothetical protein [Elusimicrobiota bacterium]
MSPLLLALALAAAPAPARAQEFPALGGAATKPYGVLILAYDVDAKWRRQLADARRQLPGHAVESVDSAGDAVSVQRAIDRLVARGVSKVVAIPLETDAASTRLEMTLYMFGQRGKPVLDVPAAEKSDFGAPLKAPGTPGMPTLKLGGGGTGLPLASGPAGSVKRLKCPVPLVLAPSLDGSTLLVDILADRAKALARDPAKESLVLAGVAPRSDEAMSEWLADAQKTADAVGRKAGFARAVAVAVRSGVGSDQQDSDRRTLRATFRGLTRQGPVDVVPLSPEADRVGQMLRQALGGFSAYRWDGKGVQGDARLLPWIRTAAEKASALPDGRIFKDGGALGAPGGFP